MEQEYCCLTCNKVVTCDVENEQYGEHADHWFNLVSKENTAVCPRCDDHRGDQFIGSFCGSCGLQYVSFSDYEAMGKV